MRILLVEDNLDLCASLLDYLESHLAVVDCAYNGNAGLELATHREFDAIILDINLPGLNGIQLCKKLRQDLRLTTPVIMLTARAELQDKLASFENGADDYLIKPFEMAELLARLQVLQKRDSNTSTVLQVGDLSFDTKTLRINREQEDITLNTFSRKLLQILMQRSPSVVSRESLEYVLWGDEPPDDNVLKIHIHNLRQRIDKPFLQAYIKTVRGEGYQLTDL
jgi:DNA-binding response OmpR family regulator